MLIAATLAATGCLHQTTTTTNTPEGPQAQTETTQTETTPGQGAGTEGQQGQATPGANAGAAGQAGMGGAAAQPPQPQGPDAHAMVLGAVSCVTQGAVANAALLGVGGGPNGSSEAMPSSGSSDPQNGYGPTAQPNGTQDSMRNGYGGQPVQSGNTQSTMRNGYGGQPTQGTMQQGATPQQGSMGTMQQQGTQSGTMQQQGMQSGTMQQQGSMGTMSPSQPVGCNTLANLAGVAPSSLRSADPSAVRQVRDMIERESSQENLDDMTRMHILSLYDKSVSAAREATAARKVADQYAINGSQRTEKSTTSTSSSTHHTTSGTHESTTTTSKKTTTSRTPVVDPSDAMNLSAHDSLRDLVEFGRTASAGPIGAEAEAVGWLLATDRFVQAQELPSGLKVLGSEPLFDTFLGVSAPASASKGTATKAVWSQYLNRAAQSARTLGPSMGGVGGGPESDMSSSHRSSSSKKGNHGGASNSAQDQANVQAILGAAEQQMDQVGNRLPPSELKIALSGYVQQLRSGIGIGGGPVHGMQPHGMQPMPGGGTTTPGGWGTSPSSSPGSSPGTMGPTPSYMSTPPSPPPQGPNPGSTSPSGSPNAPVR